MTELDPLPRHMQHLPLDAAGRPIPWFAVYDPETGEHDFRVMDGHKLARAVRQRLCWVCGGRLGAYTTFVIGPMCAITKISAEPPSHTDCARWSAMNCPFLSNPAKDRRTTGLGDEPYSNVPGLMITRNPGVTLLWTSKKWTPFRVENGVLFDIGEPTAIEWIRERRTATRAEILESIESGMPTLEAEARQVGQRAEADLAKKVKAALEIVEAMVRLPVDLDVTPDGRV